jgi:hypothetical protein
LRFDPAGQVIGFEEARPEDAELATLGLHRARFVAAGPLESVPAVSLGDLMRGDLPLSVLRGRTAVVLFSDDDAIVGRSAVDARALPARGAAAAYAALLEGGEREPAPGWLASILTMLAAASVVIAGARHRLAGAVLACAGAAAALMVLQLAFAAIFIHSLLPLSSMLVLVGLSFASTAARGLPTYRRAIEGATESAERTAAFRAQSIDAVPEAEFWPKIAALAAQAHAADFVLVAELPSKSWHLRFWPAARADERLVAERRRDVRRTPYADQKGMPRLHEVDKFLVMPDVPTVVVPLVAMGEIEGYVFLCGDKARTAFRGDPSQADRMARSLALLLRRRRMGRLMQADKLATEDARILASAWREAPVPLLYADAFGDVRMLGNGVTEILGDFGLAPAQAAKEVPLPAGTLSLARVLAALTGKPDAEVAALMTSVLHQQEGTLDVVTASGANGRREYLLSLRAVRQHTDGTSWVAAYVASLVERRETPAPPNVHVLPSPASDAIVAFSLADALAPAVAAAARKSARPVRLEPTKGQPQVIGIRKELVRVFEQFLADVAKASPAGKGPILAVRERSAWVELTVLDLDFGLPNSALEKVLIAPSSAPEGLRTFADLVNAVEASFGRVKLRATDGWGAGLTVELIRVQTKSVAAAANDTTVVDLPKWSRDR